MTGASDSHIRPDGDVKGQPPDVTRASTPSSDERSPLLFASQDSGGRLRRPVDALLMFVAAAILVTITLVAPDAAHGGRATAAAARSVVGWLDPAWRLFYTAALIDGCIITVWTLLSRRWRLLRDLAVAIATVLIIGLIVGRAVRADWPSLLEGLWRSSDEYPAWRLSVVVAILVVAGPELTRSARLFGAWLVALGAVGAAVVGIGFPSAILGGIGLGISVAALVRLVFGTSAGFPPADRVSAGLAELGTSIDGLRIAQRQRAGAATYVGFDPVDGTDLQVVVVGRDAQDTQRLANAWRNLSYRDAGPWLGTGRLQQVEHESLITLLARQAGVCAPEVRVAGLVSSGDAVLVFAQPDADPLEDNVHPLDQDVLDTIWRQAEMLRSARLAHGGLNLSNMVNSRSGPMIVRFQRGQLGARGAALNVDLAELLVTASVAAGSERAVQAAINSVGKQAVGEALPFVQRAALTPHARSLVRARRLNVEELRRRAASEAGTDLPKVVPMRRVRPRDILLTALAALTAYLVVTRLGKIGFGTIFDELRHAQWQWALVALLIAQLNFVTHAVSLRGAVRTPLPFGPCVVLQSAIKFINLTVPSSAGRIAINIRFLQRVGAPTGEAVASGAVDGIAQSFVQIVLVLVIVPFVHVKAIPSAASGESTIWLLLGLLLLVLVIAGLVLAVPKWRAKILPTVRDAIDGMIAVARTRSKRVELFGGNVATQLVYALTLGAALHAYGGSLIVAKLLLVNMAASVFASAVPVPGGIGVAEAGITAGLVAFGVDESTAFAVALTHRLCTYYLPPIWGYFALRWLTTNDYV
jgi:glycosyltransferase 2 family protein